MNKAFLTPGLISAGASSLALAATLLASQQAFAHGYLSEPPSRAYACRTGLNKDCGAAQYEPHSVGEGPKGFPALGPVDGKIASGGKQAFAPLDAQAANRWHLSEITQRELDFNWFYYSGHLTTKWEYFITRNGWNPNQPLARASFEPTPFCSVDGGGEAPINGEAGTGGPAKEKHRCTIPGDKTGQHAILALWTVDDTGAGFYNVADVNIVAEAEVPDGWSGVGTIAPSMNLLPGDSVKARAFIDGTESPQFSVTLNIASEQDGQADNWGMLLAEQVNKTQQLVRAGKRNAAGEIVPVKGVNTLYTKAESGVTRYELELDIQEDAAADLRVSAVPNDQELVQGRLSLPVPVLGNRPMDIEATVFHGDTEVVGSVKQRVESGSTWLNIDLRSEPGTHQIKLVGTTLDGRTTRQDLVSLELGGEGGGQAYDWVYPQGIAGYESGTRVLQEANGKVYQCKPFPEGGWCKINSPHHYAPGHGSNWADAWIEQ